MQYTHHAIADKTQSKLCYRLLKIRVGPDMPSAADGTDSFISVQLNCHQCLAWLVLARQSGESHSVLVRQHWTSEFAKVAQRRSSSERRSTARSTRLGSHQSFRETVSHTP